MGIKTDWKMFGFSWYGRGLVHSSFSKPELWSGQAYHPKNGFEVEVSQRLQGFGFKVFIYRI